MYDGSDWRTKHACSELDYHAIAQLCVEAMKCRVVFFRLLEAVCVSWAQFPPFLPLGQIVCVCGIVLILAMFLDNTLFC